MSLLYHSDVVMSIVTSIFLSIYIDKIDKIGTIIGSCIGVGLLLIGIIQIFMGKPLWALGTIAVGTTIIISNLYHRKNIKG